MTYTVTTALEELARAWPTVSFSLDLSMQQLAEALRKHQEREMAKRAERIVVAGYPYSHNPYLPHEPVEDCFAGCIHNAS